MQADSVTQQYAAGADPADSSASSTPPGFPSAQAVRPSPQVQADNTDVTVTAALENGAVPLSFACPNGRLLDYRRGTRGQRLPHRQVEHDSKG